ncbi:hypothetical protein MATL_G00100970 [Megalops atlanticus]|uniref:Uncharacterized protein n=1 Tax=Megalops atlanticus TaxID=7932 RepID=A0A9D3Q3M2_MEGAT|nr:hypothetical protein MATL_G00100970 [Megalops atlanticus]
MKKRTLHAALVNQLMNQTFSLSRKEIEEEQPPVKRMLERWPALLRKQFLQSSQGWQVKILNKTFLSPWTDTSLDSLIFKSKKGVIGRTLAEILAQVEMKTHDVVAMRTAVLRCLVVFLGDDGSDFFKICFDSDAVTDFTQIPVGRVMLNLGVGNLSPKLQSFKNSLLQ